MALSHKTVGSGPNNVMVVHDWTTSSKGYDALHPILDTDTFTYAFIDLRGYGGSKDIKGKYTSEEAAGDVIDLADALGWDRFHLVGHSMSGMISQRVNLENPERVISIVGVTPLGASGLPVDDEGRALFTGGATDPALWRVASGMLTGERLPEAWYKMRHDQFEADVDKEAFLGFFEMWTGENFADRMGNMSTPAMTILGEHDFMAFTEENMQQAWGQAYSDLKIVMLRNAGHYPMAECSLAFVRTLEDFLREHI